ncbi:MAG: hypothetical protein LAO30_04945 [Acidobacteriia bacterium]|nr:hypothetical protein [Terriglobia bacterium]
MRPCLTLTIVVLMAVAAFGQQPFPHPFYGPYIPLVTTPEISFQTFSPNPVGATNATTGLIAGATNSTLSQIQGSTSSEYTVPVWYQGGDAPMTSPQVHLWPEPIGRERHPMHEEHMREERGAREEAHAGWTYFTGREHTDDAAGAASAAKGFKKAGHVYTNDDVTRQNDKNGTVKYGGKTEKM